MECLVSFDLGRFGACGEGQLRPGTGGYPYAPGFMDTPPPHPPGLRQRTALMGFTQVARSGLHTASIREAQRPLVVWTETTRCSTEARGWKRAERRGAWRRRREEVRENGWLAREAQDAERLLDLCEVCNCSATDSAQLIAGSEISVGEWRSS